MSIFEWFGRGIATYLSQPLKGYAPLTTNDPATLAATLQPCDVLLVEGNTRFSKVIKTLTQSTWSHACICIGDALGPPPADGSEPNILLEVDVLDGVRVVPLSMYARFHTRICRPVSLTYDDRRRIVEGVTSRLGHQYDLKNIIDLMRYLLPLPNLVPAKWRRKALAMGSGEPTRAICSTLIAQAFQSISYPVLPRKMKAWKHEPNGERHIEEILQIRHHSLYTPRDFDISPYFEVVKPTLSRGFDYTKLRWTHLTDSKTISVMSTQEMQRFMG
jgi:hypothetical protein